MFVDRILNMLKQLWFQKENNYEKDNVINVNNWGEIYKYLMLNGE